MEDTENIEIEAKKTQNRGGRNLLILGVITIVAAFVTSVASLTIYHESGDIYLDRSRPGFLPDEKENEAKKQANGYSLPDSGEITTKTIDEYLTNLNKTIEQLNDIDSVFDDIPLSDQSLGI